MKKLFTNKRLLTLLSCLLVLPLSLRAQDKLVLSQVYGGGGSNTSTASYKTDFIEIFNAGTTSVDLSGYSVQYGSAGTSSAPNPNFTGVTVLSSTSLPGGVLAPGQYFLVSEGSAGTGGAAITTADQTGSVNLSGSAGKVALVKGSTLLNSSTGGCSDASVVDLVGYGTIFPATCAAGSAAVQGMGISASVTRNASCTNTSNNAADFTAGTPTLRNSSTTAAPCGGTGPTGPATLSVASALSNPTSIMAGSGASVTFSVKVTPGATSTGITVGANLFEIGGHPGLTSFTVSSDPTVYTYTTTIPGSVGGSNYSLPVTVTDAQGATATGNLPLTVQVSSTPIAISTLQGNRLVYTGQTNPVTVTTTGVVTSVIYNGFFIQTPSSTPGSTGIEGVNVFTSSAPTVHVGDNVNVTGQVQLYPTPSLTPALEITGSPAIVTNSTGNALPTPITLTEANLTDIHNLNLYSKYEGMRVQMALRAVSGTDHNASQFTEASASFTGSNGRFYAVIGNQARPFREPGVDVRDAGVNLIPSTVPRFDDNPERILVDTSLTNQPSTIYNATAGEYWANVVGVMDFTFSSDTYYDPVRLVPDAGYLTPTALGYKPGMSIVPVPAAKAGQVTVAQFNIEHFYNDQSSDNLRYNPLTSSAGSAQFTVTLTTPAYQGRLAKLAMAVRQVLQYPDVISFNEVENQSVLMDISKAIDADATANGKTAPGYVAYGDQNPFYTNDPSGISSGFLIKPATINFKALDQYNNTDVFTPTGGGPTIVNDRPPLVLHIGVKRSSNPAGDYLLTIIANHLKALPDNDTATQQKKELQAEQLAALIQKFSAQGEHVIATGDYNANEFSDGYGDYLGTITNNPLPANQVVTPGKSGILSVTPVDLMTKLPADQRYSYNYSGNAEVLDHIVVTPELSGADIQAGRVNADFSDILYGDFTIPNRVSDHDPVVAYFGVPPLMPQATYTGNTTFPNTNVGTTSAGQVFTITNVGGLNVTISSIAIQPTTNGGTVDFAQTNNCPTTLAPAASCQINITFTPTATGTRFGLLYITNNGGNITPFTLTGVGVAALPPPPAPSFTLSSPSITVLAGTTSTGAITVTATGGYMGTVNFTCTGTAVMGASCSVTPSVTLGAPAAGQTSATATATVTITTTARTSAGGLGALPRNGRMMYAMLVMLMAGGLFAVRKAGRNVRTGGLLAILFALAMGVTGCSSTAPLATSANANGTPAGTYTYTVTATGGGQTKSTTATVVVQ